MTRPPIIEIRDESDLAAALMACPICMALPGRACTFERKTLPDRAAWQFERACKSEGQIKPYAGPLLVLK